MHWRRHRVATKTVRVECLQGDAVREPQTAVGRPRSRIKGRVRRENAINSIKGRNRHGDVGIPLPCAEVGVC
jgi:hypothetical protein